MQTQNSETPLERSRTLRKPLDRRRLVDGAPRRIPPVGEMTELHHEICRRVLLGEKNVEIAKACRCTPQTVSNVRNSPIVKFRLRQMSEERDRRTIDMSAEVNARALRAFEIIDEALLDETGEVPLAMRLKEANLLLDRKERIDGIGQRNFHLHAHLTMEDIEELKRRALAIGTATGQLATPNEFSDTTCTCVEVVRDEVSSEGGVTEEAPIFEIGGLAI